MCGLYAGAAVAAVEAVTAVAAVAYFVRKSTVRVGE